MLVKRDIHKGKDGIKRINLGYVIMKVEPVKEKVTVEVRQ